MILLPIYVTANSTIVVDPHPDSIRPEDPDPDPRGQNLHTKISWFEVAKAFPDYWTFFMEFKG
jgi:hypothetical protein